MNRIIGIIAISILLVCMSMSLYAAWTPSFRLSNGGGTRGALAYGNDGRLHLAYERDYKIYYRERNSQGYWGNIQQLTTTFSFRPDIVADNQGRPHVFFAMTGNSGKDDLFDYWHNGTNWVLTNITNTPWGEAEPSAVVDSGGKIHLIYAEEDKTIAYRNWTNGVWSGQTNIGTCGDTYYHKPDISVDSMGRLHTVWSSSTVLYYRRYDNGWQATQTVGMSSDFFAFPKIANAGSSGVVIVVFDQIGSGVLRWTSSNNSGLSWNPLSNLIAGHWPQMKSNIGGDAHLAFCWLSNGSATGYMKFNGISWTAAERVNNHSSWQGWSNVIPQGNLGVHVVHDDTLYNPAEIGYSTNITDTLPPRPVNNLLAVNGDQSVQLNWQNPSDPDFKGSRVVFRTDRYPTHPTDGSIIYNVDNTPNSSVSFSHTNLTNGQTYYYAVFAYDLSNNFSQASLVVGVPQTTLIGWVKLQNDNIWVSLKNKVVTAVFSDAIYIEEQDRTSGIRVVTTSSGVNVNDIVDVSGNLGTRIISDKRSERQIINPTIIKKSGSMVIKPIYMTNFSVGSGTVEPNLPGVQDKIPDSSSFRDGVGVNNIGLLVKTSGRVTRSSSTSIYIDDGSNIQDISGRIGVFVSLPSGHGIQVGQYVSVTGIVQGSVPTGWEKNRRCIAVRNMNDISLVNEN